MSRTRRAHNPRLIAAVKRNRAGEPDVDNLWSRNSDGILRGDDGRLSYDKCNSARTDGEGGFALNTWDESRSKHSDVNRQRRRAGKVLAKRQLEDQ